MIDGAQNISIANKRLFVQALAVFGIVEIISFVVAFILAAAGAGNLSTGINAIIATSIFISAFTITGLREKQKPIARVLVFALLLSAFRIFDVIIVGMSGEMYVYAVIFIFVCAFVGIALSKLLLLFEVKKYATTQNYGEVRSSRGGTSDDPTKLLNEQPPNSPRGGTSDEPTLESLPNLSWDGILKKPQPTHTSEQTQRDLLTPFIDPRWHKRHPILMGICVAAAVVIGAFALSQVNFPRFGGPNISVTKEPYLLAYSIIQVKNVGEDQVQINKVIYNGGKCSPIDLSSAGGAPLVLPRTLNEGESMVAGILTCNVMRVLIVTNQGSSEFHWEE
jgi:hypothetical protein